MTAYIVLLLSLPNINVIDRNCRTDKNYNKRESIKQFFCITLNKSIKLPEKNYLLKKLKL